MIRALIFALALLPLGATAQSQDSGCINASLFTAAACQSEPSNKASSEVDTTELAIDDQAWE